MLARDYLSLPQEFLTFQPRETHQRGIFQLFHCQRRRRLVFIVAFMEKSLAESRLYRISLSYFVYKSPFSIQLLTLAVNAEECSILHHAIIEAGDLVRCIEEVHDMKFFTFIATKDTT